MYLSSHATAATTYKNTEVDTLMTNPHETTYTTSLTFQDVAGTGVNTLQIKGGTSVART